MARALALYDMRVVELLESSGVFAVPVLAAHAVYLADFEREMLAAYGVTTVQCPVTHMRFGYGVKPVLDLLAAGVNVALGTDGAASTGGLDMLQEARVAALIQKLAGRDPTLLAGDLPLRLATQNGARGLGFDAQRGVGAVAPPI